MVGQFAVLGSLGGAPEFNEPILNTLPTLDTP